MNIDDVEPWRKFCSGIPNDWTFEQTILYVESRISFHRIERYMGYAIVAVVVTLAGLAYAGHQGGIIIAALLLMIQLALWAAHKTTMDRRPAGLGRLHKLEHLMQLRSELYGYRRGAPEREAQQRAWTKGEAVKFPCPGEEP